MRALRLGHDVSLREQARKMNVHPSVLSRIERGGLNPSAKMLDHYVDNLINDNLSPAIIRDQFRLLAEKRP